MGDGAPKGLPLISRFSFWWLSKATLAPAGNPGEPVFTLPEVSSISRWRTLILVIPLMRGHALSFPIYLMRVTPPYEIKTSGGIIPDLANQV